MKIKQTPTERKALKDWNRWQIAKGKKPKTTKPKKKKKEAWYQKELNSLKRKPYKAFLMSKYWHWVRMMVFKRDGFKCTVCGSDKELQVHHTTYKHHFAEHNHLSDLLTSCHKCHIEFHTYCEIV